MNPTVQRQLVGDFIDSPVCRATLKLLRDAGYNETHDELAATVRTLFAMPATVAFELSNKATRKQQDRAQEHCKVAGERIAPVCFCDAFDNGY